MAKIKLQKQTRYKSKQGPKESMLGEIKKNWKAIRNTRDDTEDAKDDELTQTKHRD